MQREYHVPRQVTTRLEFLPGFSWLEMGAVGVGVGVGLALSKLSTWLELPAMISFFLLAVPPVVAFLAFMGGEQSLWRLFGRLRWFQARPQRMLYRAGARGPAAPVAGTRKGLGRHPRAGDGSVQGWLPVTDILGGVALRRDQKAVAVIEVQAVNMGLNSPGEQQRQIARLHEVVNSLQQPAQVLSLSRPLDLDRYVQGLHSRLDRVDPIRRSLLEPYIHYVKTLVAEGDAQERRFYIVLPQPAHAGSSADVLHLAYDLAARLRQTGLGAHVLDELELINLLHAWCNPAQAAFERAPAGPPSVTVLKEV